MGSCDNGNPVASAISTLFDLVFSGDPVGVIIKAIANIILAGAIGLLGELSTGIPTLTSTDTAKDVSGQTAWLITAIAVGSLIAAAIRMALERKAEAGTTALKGILRLVVVSTAGVAIAEATVVVSDDFAKHLFGQAVELQLRSTVCAGDVGSIEAFLYLLLALLLLLSMILHIILLYIRLGVVTVMLGTLPLAAAASMSNWGQGWWRKHLGWTIAWLLYKPTVALVMYAGTRMISDGHTPGSGGTDLRIAGIAVLLMSAIALPALLKLVMPATAALGGGSGWGRGMSAMAGGVAGGLATGAKVLTSQAANSLAGPSGARGTGGGSGRSGSSGQSGSSGRSGSSATGSAGRAGAAGALGPAGAAAAAGERVVKGVGSGITSGTTGALDGADGEAGYRT